MNRSVWSTLMILLCSFLFASCTSVRASPTPDGAAMPNPASVYCEQNGGTLWIREDAAGATGICIFPDGSQCDEWAYFRGECQPGNTQEIPDPTTVPAATPLPNVNDADIASDGCRIYRNEELGYSFHYPDDAKIVMNDDPLGTMTVVGPLVQGESWPQYSISHPQERTDYRPPEDVDLEKWLNDYNLLGDEREPDVQIAGMPAIHVRFDGSPQSYAYDRYFFAKSGQLYMVLIGHNGNEEDWGLYNHFLESIEFER